MFQEMPHQLQTAEGKKIIKNYNRIAKVLLEFEVLYHREWMRQVSNLGQSENYLQIAHGQFAPEPRASATLPRLGDRSAYERRERSTMTCSQSMRASKQ